MIQYIKALEYVLKNGEDTDDRTGVGTRTVFGYQTRFDLSEGFPAVTTKKLAWKSVVSELLWFLEGSTDERRLAELRYGQPRDQLIGKKTIWTANADAQAQELGWKNTDTEKELGPVYGSQWRFWEGQYDPRIEMNRVHDQIKESIDLLIESPYSRRNIVSAWNVDDIDKMALPPCHTMFQFKVSPSGKLDCQLYQRSCDLALGAPFNIASYALLIHLIARYVGLEPGSLVYTLGDMHIYRNHIDTVKEQLEREPYPLPQLWISPEFSLNCMYGQFPLDAIKYFELRNYKHHDSLHFPMAV